MQGDEWITASDFAAKASLSRRQIDRLRAQRPTGFPIEYDMSNNSSPNRRCPRFKLSDVDQWLASRALW
jgi:predicted DNA-binding transcriptional regulator AlpA